MPSTEAYHITEPHPSVPKTRYLYSGRGGAGNITQVNPKDITPGQTATGPAARTKITPHPADSLFTSGRGGAGNIHRERERAIFSFDEELEHQRRMMEHQAPVYHIGRGGTGNLVDERKASFSRHGSASSTSSVESDHSGRARRSADSAWSRIRHSLSKQ